MFVFTPMISLPTARMGAGEVSLFEALQELSVVIMPGIELSKTIPAGTGHFQFKLKQFLSANRFASFKRLRYNSDSLHGDAALKPRHRDINLFGFAARP
jgi:hypothetical protein